MKMTKKIDLHKKRFLKIPSHKLTPSRTCDAISGGMRGDGGPSIRSSPTNIVSSMVGCESTKAPKINKFRKRAWKDIKAPRNQLQINHI